jgi:uncharacterized NAD-dependent epimerase/dehydratase family protein
MTLNTKGKGKRYMEKGSTGILPIRKGELIVLKGGSWKPDINVSGRLPRRPEARTEAIVYGEGQLGKLDGKVTNGLVRHSEKYKIVGVVDSTKPGLDAGEFLDGVKNGIPVFGNLTDATFELDYVPKYFIYGIAPLASYLDNAQRAVIITAMKMGMNIINGLPEFFTDDEEFIRTSSECGVQIQDIRKPPPRKDLHIFSGRIFQNKTPVVTVFGTDCAVGKRTTAVLLVEALRERGLRVSFIATGQTGLLQGAKYGVAVDVLSSGFQTGEVEHAVIKAAETDQPDMIIVEGQGALSHPAFTSSTAIIRGARPQAIVLQHPPMRKDRCDFPGIPMPTLKSEIELNEIISGAKVIAITLNHEDMADADIERTVAAYEDKYRLPTTDVLKHGCDKIVSELWEAFPELRQIELAAQ